MTDRTDTAGPPATGGAPATGGPVLVTGGAGFVGCNLAASFLQAGVPVRILDDLSRPGVEMNLRWLRSSFSQVEFRRADVRDAAAVADAVRGCRRVYHLAAQVAVTTSLTGPVDDFEINARGTLNVLEAVRAEQAGRPGTPGRAVPLLFTSTNKVYGDLGGVETLPAPHTDGGETVERHRPADAALAEAGVNEERPLDFHSPYGCSKGCADQYVLDYARTYDLPATVFRMSCIYGPHQFGTEDQGWVAHFARAALRGEGVTFYGDGRQVRDVLHVADLVRAMRGALDRPDRTAGRAFNVGGGPANAVSLRQVVAALGDVVGDPVGVSSGPWRTGDQRWYVSDTSRLRGPRLAPADRLAGRAGGPRRLARRTRRTPARGRRGRRSRASGDAGGDMKSAVMKSAVFTAPGRVEIVDAPLPDPPPGGVRVRLEGCGVCHSNLPVFEGRDWFDYPRPPGSPGHEGWGVIDAVGAHVTGWAEGDRVGLMSDAAYAQFDVCPVANLAKLPAAAAGAPFPAEPLACAVNVFARSGIEAGTSVVVVGVGFLGAILVRLATHAGATATVVSRRDFSLGVGESQGASQRVPLGDTWETIAAVREVVGEAGADVVVECTGLQQPLDVAAELVKVRGRLVIAGYHQDGPRSVNLQSWNWRGIDVVNAHERDPAIYTRGMERAAELVADRVIDPAPLLTHRFPFTQAGVEAAFAALAERPDGFLKGWLEMRPVGAA